jgi:N-dimethylarginine dimethylaminohydrolase
LSAASHGRLREEAGRDKLIDVGPEDAAGFAANAVAIGSKVIMSACGDDLRARLAERGYEPVVVPLEAFRMAGGAAFCLTLRLNHMSAVAARAARKRA